jgi:hypothetical protein
MKIPAAYCGACKTQLELFDKEVWAHHKLALVCPTCQAERDRLKYALEKIAGDPLAHMPPLNAEGAWRVARKALDGGE